MGEVLTALVVGESGFGQATVAVQQDSQLLRLRVGGCHQGGEQFGARGARTAIPQYALRASTKGDRQSCVLSAARQEWPGIATAERPWFSQTSPRTAQSPRRMPLSSSHGGNGVRVV